MDTCTTFEWKLQTGTRTGTEEGALGRFGCSATLLGHHIWVIGGFISPRSCYILNVNTRTWEPVHVNNVFTGGLILHSASLFQDKVYLFGAVLSGTGFRTDKLWALDVVTRDIEIKSTYGGYARPDGRRAHSTDVCETLGILALFGGSPEVTEDQLWILDLFTWQWRRPTCKGQLPSPRAKHSSSMIDSRLYIYNGGKVGRAQNDLYMIDLSRRNHLVWHKLSLNGHIAIGARGAAMAYVGSGRLVIFGGFRLPSNTNDLLVIDNLLSPERTCTKVTSLPSGSASIGAGQGMVCIGPRPRAQESANLVFGHNRAYLFGVRSGGLWDYFELNFLPSLYE